MAIAAGTRLGPYEVLAPVGAGGMGEVYRARDPRIGRDVALKVLPASFAEDADRLRRFEQEARATGQLNHPNILAVHDVGALDGAPYVVSELLEGDTLRDRIGGTPLPVRKAIDFGTQIARGLAAAHEKGVVHRDLKPENVFVTRDGRIKILDFGLAKLVAGDVLTESETHTRAAAPGTDAGKVLGTVGYMSPEQVRAHPVDHRSDIFSFGSVLYEMLSGQHAFRGASAVETMNAILKEDPPELSATSRSLPPALERIVSHCLEKNPEERFQSARDIAFDLEQLSGTSVTSVGPVPHARRFSPRLPLIVGAIALAAAAGFVVGRQERPSGAAFERVSFRRERIRTARFAPDGRTIVYESAVTALPEVMAAQTGGPEARSLGLGEARLSAVSSKGELAVRIRRQDGAERTLARVPLRGGSPRDVLEDVDDADWAPDGETLAILRFTGSAKRLEFPPGKKVYEAPNLQRIRVSPKGDRIAFTEHPFLNDNRGSVCVVDREGRKTELSSGWEDVGPLAWSSDGNEVLFSATRHGTEHSIHAVTLEGRERLVHRIPGSVDVYDVAPDGRVLLGVNHGQPRILGRGPGDTRERDLSWLDYGIARSLSPDGRTLLFDEEGLGGGAKYSTYVRAMDGSPPVRLGSGGARALSPDGRWALVFEMGPPPQAVLLPTGAGDPKPLPRGSLAQLHFAVFAGDGRRVYLLANEPGHEPRVWEQDMEGGEPRPLTDAGIAGLPSPDGKRAVVLVKSVYEMLNLDGTRARRPLSGLLPTDELVRFTADGRFLIVRAQGDQPARLFRVEVDTGKRDPFKELGLGAGATGLVSNLDVTDDGRSYVYTYFDSVDTLYVAEGLK